MLKRTYVYRDGKIVEVTSVRQRKNLPTVDKEQMERKDSCYVLDDLRQDYQRSSDRDRLAFEKTQRGE